MRVKLAGFNVDAEVLDEMREQFPERQDITPEVLSAAYARISRDGRPIADIRREARFEVEKARKSNSAIIFKMGHHSVAEHAVFNLDIVGISRLAMEEMEKFRLSSYTEKSQRYITLGDDFVVPDEIKSSRLRNIFIQTIRLQNEAYSRFFEKFKIHIFKKYEHLSLDPKNFNLLEGWAKEDARYITSLATESQVGQTVNARTLELILRRFASHELSEIRSLGKAIYKEISGVAPSIVLFHEANNRDLKTYPCIKEAACSMIDQARSCGQANDVELVEYPIDGDIAIAASLFHTATDLNYNAAKNCVNSFSRNKVMEIFKAAWKNMEFYDSMPREFEYANLTFNVSLSAACFGQLKRHRMTTITSQNYEPSLGVTIPKVYLEVGLEREFKEIITKTEGAYEQIKKEANKIELTTARIINILNCFKFLLFRSL